MAFFFVEWAFVPFCRATSETHKGVVSSEKFLPSSLCHLPEKCHGIGLNPNWMSTQKNAIWTRFALGDCHWWHWMNARHRYRKCPKVMFCTPGVEIWCFSRVSAAKKNSFEEISLTSSDWVSHLCIWKYDSCGRSRKRHEKQNLPSAHRTWWSPFQWKDVLHCWVSAWRVAPFRRRQVRQFPVSVAGNWWILWCSVKTLGSVIKPRGNVHHSLCAQSAAFMITSWKLLLEAFEISFVMQLVLEHKTIHLLFRLSRKPCEAHLAVTLAHSSSAVMEQTTPMQLQVLWRHAEIWIRQLCSQTIRWIWLHSGLEDELKTLPQF